MALHWRRAVAPATGFGTSQVLERRQLETKRNGELRAAVEGTAQLDEVQRFAERVRHRRSGLWIGGHASSMPGAAIV